MSAGRFDVDLLDTFKDVLRIDQTRTVTVTGAGTEALMIEYWKGGNKKGPPMVGALEAGWVNRTARRPRGNYVIFR